MTHEVQVMTSKVVQGDFALERRDDLGFSIGPQTPLTRQQITWILTYSNTGSLLDANDAADVGAGEALEWMEDSGFLALYNEARLNKRESVKTIGTQLLTEMMLALQEILQSGNNKEKLSAAKLLSNQQGLLIDNAKKVDKDALQELLEELRRPRPHVIYKEV